MLTLLGTAILIVGLWGIRNYAAFGKLIPISNNGGLNLWMGSNPQAYGSFVNPFSPDSPLLQFMDDELVLDAMARRLGLEYALEHPLRVLQLLPAKVFYLFNSNDSGLEWNQASGLENPQAGTGLRAYALVNFVYTIEMIFASLGVISLFLRKNWDWRVWAGVLYILYFTLLHLPFFGKDRFALPLIPFLLFYSALGMWEIANLPVFPHRHQATRPQ
jgi:hypothetical protein